MSRSNYMGAKDIAEAIRAARNQSFGPRVAISGTPDSRQKIEVRHRVEDLHDLRRINQRDYQ